MANIETEQFACSRRHTESLFDKVKIEPIVVMGVPEYRNIRTKPILLLHVRPNVHGHIT